MKNIPRIARSKRIGYSNFEIFLSIVNWWDAARINTLEKIISNFIKFEKGSIIKEFKKTSDFKSKV